MKDRYSVFGPESRLPSDMLRAILVPVAFKITSYTRFAADLKENPLHAIISGFFVDDTPADMAPCAKLWEIFNTFFLQNSASMGLISLNSLALAGDGTPVYTSAQERKTRTCNCLENGIRDCKCNRIYHQPDCDIGWDSHHNRYYFGYDLYMLTASDSENDLPVFPFLCPASRHNSHGFLYNWFSIKKMLPEVNVTKLLLVSAHDAMPYYDYCKKNNITPFIDLNWKCGRPPVYKDDILNP